MTTYAHNGLAGCVAQRKSRTKNVLVGLYNAEQAGYDSTSGAWVLVCEEHGEYVQVSSMKAAQSHMPTVNWCECCENHN